MQPPPPGAPLWAPRAAAVTPGLSPALPGARGEGRGPAGRPGARRGDRAPAGALRRRDPGARAVGRAGRQCRSSTHTRVPPRAAPPARLTGRPANFPKLRGGKS